MCSTSGVHHQLSKGGEESSVSTPTLSGCIVQSLKNGEMTSSLAGALLSRNRTQVLRRDETQYWDYKERIDLDNPIEVARIAKDVLGFYNAKGGVLIVGVTDDFRVVGIPESNIADTNILRAKLRKYIGSDVPIFQDSVTIPNGRMLWLIFVGAKNGLPVSAAENGPQGRDGRPVIRRNEYYIRVHDETKVCIEPADYERVFTGVSLDHLQAYLYDVDEPYFRLLAPHCDRFIGRLQLLGRLRDGLKTRHPVVALEGVGGVGKTAAAIELVRQLYDERNKPGGYAFIVSLSAKSKVWHYYTGSRRAGFSGLTEFLTELAKVLEVPLTDDLEKLRISLVGMMRGVQGLLLIDNIEELSDSGVMKFLAIEVPEPVKVIVTSRIERKIGGLPLEVPQMTHDESRQLLFQQLEHLGYTGFLDESEYVEEILKATGGLPLALSGRRA
jgi:hypothetical protein